MCLIWFSYQNIRGLRLLVAANRDEFLARATAPLAWHGDVLAGWDEQDGGTWLGLNRHGHLAALTNHRDPSRQRQNPPSRGGIVTTYLDSGLPARNFLTELRRQAARYNPFNLLLLDSKELLFYSNADDRAERVAPGEHALSNKFLDTDWPKTRRIKELLAPLAKNPTIGAELGPANPTPFFTALHDQRQPPDDELPKTGVGLAWERRLAPIFIESPTYGTRSSAMVAIGQNGQIDFYERTHSATGERRENPLGTRDSWERFHL